MSRWTQCALLAVALAFIAAGMLFVPRLGISSDEAVVANGIYEHGDPWFSLKFAGSELPLMILGSLGALKAWFYNLVFLFLAPRPIVMRLPTLAIAAGTLWLFFIILDRTVSRRAAWIGTLLLATDTSYLLQNAADYGHVTFPTALKLGALALLIRFRDKASRKDLAWAFFLLGLGLWERPASAWALLGLAAGAAVVFPRDVRVRLNRTNVVIAVLALLAGVLPLMISNIARPSETTRAVAAPMSITATLAGSAMFGFLTAAEPGPRPGQPNHWYQSLSLAASRWTGHPHRNAMLAAAIASVLSLAFLWKSHARQPILFGLIASAGALMAGDAALMWPFHLLPAAVALAQLPASRAAMIAAALCAWNLAVTNQSYADLICNGPAIRWTDAMDPLHRYLTDLRARRIVAADEGFMETMNLLGEGELPMYRSGSQSIEALLRDSSNVFVAHTPAFALHPEERAALEDLARREHYQQETLTTIQDRNGRPTFDVFRFRKLHL